MRAFAVAAMLERLQKIIARAGVASRRHAEQLVLAGEVTLNGRVVTELGTKADAARDHIKVRGKLLRRPEEKLYVLLHKPPGCVATMSDPEGRRTVAAFLRGVPGRVFPVGRLDYHASGLLLLTNDGELANAILRAGLPQTYWLKVKGALEESAQRELERRTGARLGPLRRGKGKRGERGGAPANPWYEATLTAARRDPLRDALAPMGHPVEKLKRVRLGPLELGGLEPGTWRGLEPGEIVALRRAVRRSSGRMPRAPRQIQNPRGPQG